MHALAAPLQRAVKWRIDASSRLIDRALQLARSHRWREESGGHTRIGSAVQRTEASFQRATGRAVFILAFAARTFVCIDTWTSPTRSAREIALHKGFPFRSATLWMDVLFRYEDKI